MFIYRQQNGIATINSTCLDGDEVLKALASGYEAV